VRSRPRLQNVAAARLAVYNSNMPWTFSLTDLILVVTLIGVACGLAVNFPKESLGLLSMAIFFTPTLGVYVALRLFYKKDGGQLFWLVFTGAIFGAFITDNLMVEGGRGPMIVNGRVAIVLGYIIATGPATLCGLLFGLPLVIAYRKSRRSQNQQPEPQAITRELLK
jgi:hypothetical protein